MRLFRWHKTELKGENLGLKSHPSLGTTHYMISEERDEPYQDEEARLEEKQSPCSKSHPSPTTELGQLEKRRRQVDEKTELLGC